MRCRRSTISRSSHAARRPSARVLTLGRRGLGASEQRSARSARAADGPPESRGGCEKASRSTTVAVRRDAPLSLGGSRPVARAGGRLPGVPVSGRGGARADRQQDLSDRARPTGGRSTARLLPGAEREGTVHALSAVPDSISLVIGEVKGMLTNDGRRVPWAAITFAAGLLLLPIFGSGCAPRAKAAANPAPGRAQGSPAVDAGDVMSSQDRARLEALAAPPPQEPTAEAH